MINALVYTNLNSIFIPFSKRMFTFDIILMSKIVCLKMDLDFFQKKENDLDLPSLRQEKHLS